MKMLWNPFGYSEPIVSRKCPKCNCSLTGLFRKRVKFFDKNNNEIMNVKINIFATYVDSFKFLGGDRFATAVCQECGHRFPLFMHAPEAKSREDIASRINETHVTDEPLGDEDRNIDNSNSSSTLRRSFTISREWTRSYTLSQEKVIGSSTEFAAGLTESASFKARAEDTLKNKYILSEEAKQVYKEEVVVEVLPRTKTRLRFHWKRLWQHGVVTLYSDGQVVAELPFQVIIGLTFDQTQSDG